jgi:tetratricopeptide (TPR) repeat protein
MADIKSSKEQIKVEDALTRSEAFVIKYQKPIVSIIIAILIIILGFFCYKKYYVKPHEEKAQAALFPGQKYFEQDQYDKALNGDKNGFIGLLGVEDEYSGTKAANLAKAYAGICYANLGKYQDAIDQLKSFDADDEMVAPAIISALGNCYAQVKEYDKATEYLMKAAEKADNSSLSPLFLIQAGEIYEEQGQIPEWPNGADCKSAGLRLRWFESIFAHIKLRK